MTNYFGATPNIVPPDVVPPNPVTITVPDPALNFGGYAEDRNTWEANHWAADDQATYIKQRTELQRAIKDCLNGSPACNLHIKDFADMLERVKAIPDRQIQLEAIQAWGNLYVDYDNVEADGLDHGGGYRTLKQAIIDRKGVCAEQAWVKLFALEYLGFDPDNIRWMVENYYVDGQRQKHPHAVTVVRVGDTNWVLNNWAIQNWAFNNQAPYSENGAPSISYQQVQSLISSASQVEQDTTELNNSGHSIWNAGINHAFVPAYSMNGSERIGYDISIENNVIQPPDVALTANASTALLYYAASEQGGAEFRLVMDILRPAVAVHYNVDESVPVLPDGTYPRTSYPIPLPHQ